MTKSVIGSWFLTIIAAFCLFSVPVLAGKVEVNEAGETTEQKPSTGRRAAEKYMGRTPAAASASKGPSDHYLALHLGSFFGDNAYRWGRDSETNVGKYTLGVTYRVGEWTNSMDMNFRADLSSYQLAGDRATKLSFLPVIIFPDANSKFPLYFGAGAGVGVFLKQLQDESSLSLDYQLFLGARFFDLIDNTGFFIEGGLKNHIHLLSDGQYNGTFLALGAVFTF